jgi:hypothetical protein
MRGGRGSCRTRPTRQPIDVHHSVGEGKQFKDRLWISLPFTEPFHPNQQIYAPHDWTKWNPLVGVGFFEIEIAFVQRVLQIVSFAWQQELPSCLTALQFAVAFLILGPFPLL